MKNEVPNDPRRRHRRGHAVRRHGLMPHVLVSLALWLLLLIAFPAWMIIALVVTLLVSCAANALVPLLPRSGAGRPGVEIVGFTHED